MENASKALIMAAGVLFSAIILTFVIFLYSSFSEKRNENMKEMEYTQISGFNSRYLAYDGKEELTYYDIINVANMARSNNSEFRIEDEYYIKVFVDNEDITQDNNYNNFKIKTIEKLGNGKGVMEMTTEEGTGGQEKVLKLKKYACKVTINSNNGRVKLVEFEEIN